MQNQIQADPEAIFAMLGRKTFEAEFYLKKAAQLQQENAQLKADQKEKDSKESDAEH